MSDGHELAATQARRQATQANGRLPKPRNMSRSQPSGRRRSPTRPTQSTQSAQSAASVSGGHGHESIGILPTGLLTQAPDRPHWHSHRDDGGRADIGPFGLRSRAQVRMHARTHARAVAVVLLAIPSLPSRCVSWRAVRVTSACLVNAHAPRAAATLLVIAHATSRVRTCLRQRASTDALAILAEVGYGTPQSPDAGIPREVARGTRDAHAAVGVRARFGASPCAARHWVMVRPPVPSWPNAPELSSSSCS